MLRCRNNVSIYTGVICEDDVFLGPSMVFTNVTNPRSAVNRKSQYAKTRVKKGASIGANATIVCGHDIGRFRLYRSRSCGDKRCSRLCIVIGNPARQTGWMSEYGHKLQFDKDGMATCPESQQRYQLKANSVSRIS
jgi:UDP-2-acetamido-3-amino-2,3-dideoxy-glucuronate N-acetyltransferase